MTKKRRIRETQNAENGAESRSGRKRSADSSESRGSSLNKASASYGVDVGNELDNARKRDRALREALKKALARRNLERSGFGIAVNKTVPKSHKRPATRSDAVDDHETLDMRKQPAAGSNAVDDQATLDMRKRSVASLGRVDDQATLDMRKRSVASLGRVDDQATLDVIGTAAAENHYRFEAVRGAIAAEWALEKPIQEKIDNAIDLALFFYRTVMNGDTRQTLGLASIEGFLSDVRREVLDLLRPDDNLTGVKRALLVISTLGRDKGWKWADDVTLALFFCENGGFAEKAREIKKTLPMLIDRPKLVSLRKIFS